MNSIQYTVRGVPPDLDAELRREAQLTGKALNTLVVETLQQAKLRSSRVIDDGLDWFVGVESPDGERDSAQAWLDTLPAELG
jgi:hypothetical protein